MVKEISSSIKDESLIVKRRAQLHKGAVTLFKQKGFHRATTREIAKAAGFSIGTLYEYIRKKEDVLFLVCDAIYDEVKARMEAVIDTDTTSESSLFQAVESYFQLMDELQDEVLILYQELKALPKDAQEYVLNKEKEMLRLFEIILENSYKDILTQDEITLISNNIFIQGQMWGFRRWVLQKEFSLEQYTQHQFSLLKNQLAHLTQTKQQGGV
ncbi:TetR/AcrR family transcriptional regulator [Alkalibacillus haloalkaliphilus]|uniref:TetR/AcrR family transcriptional regulator n=1 Tax=Alkalibacillus haloalkaliphilus TaxID=94136 RepID=UPI002936721C|nr:TetR/AcrR family transcriptional regulator [Alkalibacillus haloalkaliphilus]MDV2583126.1 TetR/AcrR family transcriptional regulator [Alkalibacillus haloalkaliphilus]